MISCRPHIPIRLDRSVMTRSVFDHFYRIGIIPVLEIDSPMHARPLAEYLQMERIHAVGGS